MKSTTSLLVILFIFGFSGEAEAQFIKKLGQAAERAAKRTVEKRVEKETAETTDEALDKVFEGEDSNKNKKGKNKNSESNKRNDKNSNKENTNSDNTDNPSVDNTTVNTAKDYERGNKVIFHEQFSNDAMGDFPGTWNTNGSGEVVTIGNSNTRWLKVVKGLYVPDGINSIPENSTLEMDIHYYHDSPRSFTLHELRIQLVALKDKNTEFTTWKDGWGKDGVRILIKPWEKTGGQINVWNRIDNKTVLKTETIRTQEFSATKGTVHLSIWRQGNRIRVYLDDKKVFDLPRAFAGKNYNSLIFDADASNETPFYVSNIVLAAEAGADTRHKLLETGTFTTSDILFETGKATIQPSSFSILDEIADVLIGNPAKHLTITGHTDSDGSETANQTLSEQRAESVKNYLVYKHNISSDQITTKGKGESEPVASGDSAKAKAQNRRVEFTLK